MTVNDDSEITESQVGIVCVVGNGCVSLPFILLTGGECLCDFTFILLSAYRWGMLV